MPWPVIALRFYGLDFLAFLEYNDQLTVSNKILSAKEDIMEKKAWTYETMSLGEKISAMTGMFLGIICFVAMLLINVVPFFNNHALYLFLGCVAGLLLYIAGTKPWQQ